MRISVKNFWVFKEMTEFEIRPITVLVGPNNSGKSSFTKLLLLLKNGFLPSLNFKEGEHQLESMKKSMNWNSRSERLILQNKKTYSMLPGNFMEEIIYDKEGNLQKMSVYTLDSEKKKPTTIFKLTPSEEPSAFFNTQDYNYMFNIRYFIKLFYEKQIKVLAQGSSDNLFRQELSNVSNRKDVSEASSPFYLEGIFLSNYKKFIKENNLTFRNYGVNSIIINSILINELDRLNKLRKEFLFYDLYFDNKNVTQQPEIKAKLIEIQNEKFKHGVFIFDFFVSKYDQDYLVESFSKLKGFINSLNKFIKSDIKEYFEEEYLDVKKIKVKENELGSLFFKEKFFLAFNYSPSNKTLMTSNKISLAFSFFEAFIQEIFAGFQAFTRAIYIPANRGHQERLLFHSKNSEKYNKAVDFINKYNNSDNPDEYNSERANELITEILKTLKIEGEIQPKIIENSAVAIYIKKDSKMVNLADFGFGYSQLIPVILTVYNEMAKDVKPSNQIFIIEEPEANLHPALQSKLADIFHLIIKYNPNWELIIETHSEYLIRKLQYLTAKKELKTDDCIIHYFNADENVSSEEPKVKKIEINEEGNLTENFGPGFYDEATRLQFELLKLNSGQKN